MRVRKSTIWAGIILSMLLVIALAAACGGSSSSTTPAGPLQGDGPLSGSPTNGGGGGGGTVAPGSGLPGPWGAGAYTPAPATGTSTNAPLGTDPTYNVVEVGGETSHSTSRTPSVRVGPIDVYLRITDVTMMPADVAPNWELTSATFSEGDFVDLWVQYEMDPNVTLHRDWVSADIGLDFTEPNVTHAASGVYEAKLQVAIPFGTAKEDCIYNAAVNSADLGDTSDDFPYTILAAGPTERLMYPFDPDSGNDLQGGGGGCKPEWISADFTGTSVTIGSAKELSNAVLWFTDGKKQKWDGLNGYTKTIYGTGSNSGKQIQGVWIKSGCNSSGDGPGYGEYVSQDGSDDFKVGFAQMAWEDLIDNADYDYNDFVGRLNAIERRNASNQLVQIQFTIKAVARAAGYDADWQFNINGAFPGATAFAIVNQYYANGEPHGPQKIWRSTDGTSIPVFTPIREALPNPPGSYATNGIPGTLFIDGDYAEVTVVFDQPLSQGSYTPAPYSPELRVQAAGGSVYTVPLWRKKGDAVDGEGRPLAFIIPDTYTWPLEGKSIWTVFDEFSEWTDWIDASGGSQPTPHWYDLAPMQDYFRRDLFQ